MTLELWLSIIAIIASVASVIFVIVEVGIKLGVEFREEETTSTRKDKIEKALKDESNTELATIAELIASKKASEQELKEKILNLARIEYYSDFTTNLLDKMNTYSNNFLRGTIISVIAVFITISISVITFQDVTSVNILFLVAALAYLVLTIYSLHKTYQSIRKYYDLRNAFVRLSEEPSCNKCEEIYASLEDKGISI